MENERLLKSGELAIWLRDHYPIKKQSVEKAAEQLVDIALSIAERQDAKTRQATAREIFTELEKWKMTRNDGIYYIKVEGQVIDALKAKYGVQP